MPRIADAGRSRVEMPERLHHEEHEGHEGPNSMGAMASGWTAITVSRVLVADTLIVELKSVEKLNGITGHISRHR